MSRIGKRPIEVPSGVSVTIEPGHVSVSGPLGSLEQDVPQRMQIAQEDGTVLVTRPTERGEDRALHGLTRTLIANMVEGVTNGFEKKLEIQGVGYRAALKGNDLELNVGYSHVGDDRPAPRHLLRGARADADHRQGNEQAACRPDRRGDPQGAPAGAVQGQGHPLRRRVRAQKGRQAGLA